MNEERRSKKAGPPGERYTLRCPIDFGAIPRHFNCRSSLSGTYTDGQISDGLRRLAQDLRSAGLDAAADALLLPTGPTNAPGSWEEVAKVLGYDSLRRISKIAGA